MSQDDESRTDAAWREIVDHYGERARLDDEAAAEAAEPAPLDPDVVDDDPEPVDDVPDTERFVPPPAPPVPLPRTWQRAVAWLGLFGSPLVGLVLTVTGVRVAPLLGWVLVGWFVGGFVYLVATMGPPPREPWDDGSRV